MNDILNSFLNFFREHINEISMAYAATIFSIFGNDIFKQIRKKTKKLNFLLRTSIFVAVCAFGIGAITSIAGRLIGKIVSQTENIVMFFIIIALFITAGIVAEYKKQI